MTEIEKLETGLEYCYDDPEVEARKDNAIIQCKKYNAIDDTDYDAQYAKLAFCAAQCSPERCEWPVRKTLFHGALDMSLHRM